MSQRRTILVSGMVAAQPGQGGAVWAVLQYVLGLRRLGHQVFLLEPVRPDNLLPAGSPLQDSHNARYFQSIVEGFGLTGHAALVVADTRETFGADFTELLAFARRADAHLNIAGMLTDPRLTNGIPARIYLDLDPAFTQLWQAAQGIDMRLNHHTHHVTIGLNLGQPGCDIPTCQRHWITTVQPVVLEHWPAVTGYSRDALTTVANWRGYGSVDYQGTFYGQKAHSLRAFFSLPHRTSETFALALSIHPNERKDLDALRANGWTLLDPAQVADTPAAYRAFVQDSKAEFGIAKSGYVQSRCGWFSDRSIAYLASGKPVLAQDTAFANHFPTGKGILPFTNLDDALAAIESLKADYPGHAAAARQIAEECFNSDRVLPRLLSALGC